MTECSGSGVGVEPASALIARDKLLEHFNPELVVLVAGYLNRFPWLRRRKRRTGGARTSFGRVKCAESAASEALHRPLTFA
jgi:hypothetical protein